MTGSVSGSVTGSPSGSASGGVVAEGQGKVVALSGGVGGAKLAVGLQQIIPPQALCVVANTGDDFVHLGLHISPDLDSNMYALAGVDNPDTGWGIAGDSWQMLEQLQVLGGESWFRLGDKDLAIHLQRRVRLDRGERLSPVTAALARALGVRCRLLPMSDDPVRTFVLTAKGELAFQHYFVRESCRPVVRGFRFEGADEARPAPGVLEALADPELVAVVICPSNPLVSLAPMLAMKPFRQVLSDRRVPLVAVSPIVGGAGVKGPLGKMLSELDLAVSGRTVAAWYGDLLDGFVLDATEAADADSIAATGVRVLVTDTLMRSFEDRVALAARVLDFARSLDRSLEKRR